MSKDTISYECRCGVRWALAVYGGKIFTNPRPSGRKAGRCYCGKTLTGGDE